MTTKVHIVNLGPQPVEVLGVAPSTEQVDNSYLRPVIPVLHPQQFMDVYVHSTQAIKLTECSDKK